MSEVIFQYYVKRWCKESISTKLQLSKLIISKIIWYFKKLSKHNDQQILSYNKRKTKFNDEHIEWIGDYIKNHENQHYTINMIMQAFNDHFGDAWTLSASTLRDIIKNKLWMRFRKIEKANTKTYRTTNVRLLWESMALQWELQYLGYELIFIDEFSWSSRNNNVYGWCRSDIKRRIESKVDTFKISCIVAFSKFRFYGLMGSSGTIDSTIFGIFLYKLLKSIHKNHSIDSNNLIFVMDNASIHKSSHVAGMLKNKAVRILTIAPYEPWLNPAEKLILALKSKLRMLHNRGKLITLSIAKSVADEIAQVKLESTINSSIKETLDKMKKII